jgi:hypothetical protein
MQVVPPVHVPLAHWLFIVQGWPLASRQVCAAVHASFADVQSPLTLHATQVSCSMSAIVSQTGLGAVHADVEPVAHWTQVLLVMSQTALPAVMHCVFATHCTQDVAPPPIPVQTPGFPPLMHAVPDAAFPQVPFAPPHTLHGPLHAVAQHTLSTQKVLVHWLPSPPVQAWPFACAGEQWFVPSQ